MPSEKGTTPRNSFRASEYPEHAWLGYLLYLLRKKRGLSQEELGVQLGRNHTFIHRIESGLQAIDVATLFRHCEITGGDAVELIRTVRDDPPKIPKSFLNRSKGKPKKA